MCVSEPLNKGFNPNPSGHFFRQDVIHESELTDSACRAFIIQD
jgi:hypothetical protein